MKKVIALAPLLFITLVSSGYSQDINLNFNTGDTKPGDVASTVEILFIITVIGLVPSILVLMTAFTRIFIVFGILRRALGLQGLPPDQVLIGLALFVTSFIMWPTFERIYNEAVVPYRNNQATVEVFKTRAMRPLKEFMFKHVHNDDLRVMLDLSDFKYPEVDDREFKYHIKPKDIPTHVLVPAFVMSELTEAFKIGFYIYIPFLMIDLILASLLMSMGMMMVPPMILSLPFKLLLFILVDGWNLLIVNLVKGFL